MEIKRLIGDYEGFFAEVKAGLDGIGIDISRMPLSHLNYRVETAAEYVRVRDGLKAHCRQFVETQFNGRAVSILVLEVPVKLADGYEVSVIELPAPRPAHMYPRGLEHLGIVVGEDLPAFKAKYARVITGVKDRRPYCFPAFITFAGGVTAKFYERDLLEVVRMQGWELGADCL